MSEEGFISVGFMLLVSQAVYYIIGAINKTFPSIDSFSVWKQMEYIIGSN